MDNPVCTSCHKGLSLEEIERASFQRIGGRLYCGDCVGKMRRAGPVKCPECGTTDTPLYTGAGYQCRKCGAALKLGGAKGAPAAQAPAQRMRPRAASKPCPYCGAPILAEALKCRYCGSSLTREARDLEAVGRQNSQLRFWVGALLSASVFLAFFLIYILATRRPQGEVATVPAPAPQAVAPAKADPSVEAVKALREELRAIRGQLAALEAENRRLAAAAAPSPPPVTTTMPKALIEAMRPPPPKKDEPAPPKPPEPAPKPPEPKQPPTPAPLPKSPEPAPPETVPKAKPPTAKAAEERTAAQLAAAAYPVFATALEKMKAARRYGDALGACRQFLAAHLGTPEAAKVQATQKALREELDKLRDDFARRFKEAMEKRDADGARKVAAELAAYNAPEIREDHVRMLAELEASKQQPRLDVAKYLAQWEATPTVARFLQELKNDKEWTARSRAAKELGRIGHRAAIQGLMEALRDPEFYVKVCAINSLSDIGDPIALPAIAPLTKASFPVIYDAAARATATLAAAPREKFPEAWKLIDLSAVTRELADALKVQDKEDSPATSRYQIALLDALGLLDAKEAAPVIRPLAEKAKDPAVRAAAANALKRLAGDSPAPVPPPPPKAEPPKDAPAKAPPP